MKGIAIFLLLAALGAAGCLTPPLPGKPEAPKQPVVEAPPAPPQPPPAPPVVLPDQVTEANAAEKLEELRRELAYAAAQPMPTTTVSAKPEAASGH